MIKFCILLTLIGIFFSLENKAFAGLKTINVSIPTDYGLFLSEIHFEEKDLDRALEVERIVKTDLIKVINYFGYVPLDVVHFNFDPNYRLTNGNARTFPTNIINLYNFPASGNEHLIAIENWILGLVLHEFVHIVHLDQTRGWLHDGRNIFGTFAKIPTSIVPRWFSEGIAVWGESHLINGGRLNNSLFTKELLIQFKRHDFCKTIDCLDGPGVFPHGQLSYWAGAHFIEWLEARKANTIKCLVVTNSSEFPFFLNGVFKECTGEKASDLFLKFREEFISKYTDGNDVEQFGTKINNIVGVDDFQRGVILEENTLYKVEREKYSQSLVAYDLENEINWSKKYSSPINQLAGIAYGENDEKFLLVSFSEDLSGRGPNKTWKLINPETLFVERELLFKDDPSYVIGFTKNSYLTFSYVNNHWVVRSNERIIKEFKHSLNILGVNKISEEGDGKILLKVIESDNTASLIETDATLSTMKIIYSSKNFYELLFLNSSSLILKEGDDYTLVEYKENVKSFKINQDLFKNITFVKARGDYAVYLKNRLNSKKETSEQLINSLKNDAKLISSTKKIDYKESSDELKKKDDLESFPRWDHFIPHYWFLASASSENMGNFGAMTTLMDPMEVHKLDASLYIYPEDKKIGTDLFYDQKLIEISDLWSVYSRFSQNYSKNSYSSVINDSNEFLLGTNYIVYHKDWRYIPSAYLQLTNNNDFISARDSRNIGFVQLINYQSLSRDNFFQTFFGSFKFQENYSNLKNYFSFQTILESNAAFSENLWGYAKFSYEKLFKSDFSSGVIYGGGLYSGNMKRTHDYYGIPYSNAYGNELFTLKMYVDYNLLNIYRGKNLIPFFMKELHFIFGRESIYAERIYLDKVFLKEKMINAIFGGPRLKADLFYFIPVNVDLIFSSIAHPNGKNIGAIDFSLVGEIF